MQVRKERPSAGGIPSLPEGREILPLNVDAVYKHGGSAGGAIDCEAL
jgi:hypothetical protein